MKKLIAIAVILGFSAGAQAAVGFSFGTNFYKPNAKSYETKNGRNFLVNWSLDNDLFLGVYEEDSQTFDNTVTAAPAGPTPGALNVSAIQVAKGVVKNVVVGLNLGSGAVAGAIEPLVDVFGAVNILSGQGEKVSGALKATVAARFCEVALAQTAGGAGGKANGLNLGLAVDMVF